MALSSHPVRARPRAARRGRRSGWPSPFTHDFSLEPTLACELLDRLLAHGFSARSPSSATATSTTATTERTPASSRSPTSTTCAPWALGGDLLVEDKGFLSLHWLNGLERIHGTSLDHGSGDQVLEEPRSGCLWSIFDSRRTEIGCQRPIKSSKK
jgi:hypothetical protein